MFFSQTVITISALRSEQEMHKPQIKKATKNAAFSLENRSGLSVVFDVLNLKPDILGQFF